MTSTFTKFKKVILQDKIKILLILVTLIIGVLYIIWRTLFVMSWAINIPSAVWGLVVLWADFYGFANLMSFSFETLNNRDVFDYFKIKDHKPDYNPSVDVFICTYNEDPQIVRKTAMAASFMNYENKKVYILDDGNRPELEEIARNINVNYITREENINYKAGNLNNALSQTNGELFVVFDADHVPTNLFLNKLIDFFQEDSVALVQTPQHFYNPDPFQRNLEMHQFITNEQDLFFKIIQPGRSYWNATICCGTNWMARRTAIEQIGGIPTDSITEDMLTSIKLQENNYKTLYFNEPVAAGLSAESINEYIMQRNRWGKGTVQIYFSEHNPLKNKNLNIAQKICYLGSINYYFVGLARIIFLLAPCIFILFNLQSCVATIKQLLMYQLPYLFFLFATYFYISKGMRKPLFTEAYEAVISYDLANVLVRSLISPKSKTKFRVTEKNIQRTKAYFDYVSLMPMLIIFLIMIVSLLLLPVCFYFDLRNHEGLIINGFWLFFNLIIMIVVFQVGFERPQKRKYTRIPVHKSFELLANDKSYLIYSLNLSESGTLLYSKEENLELEKDQMVYFVCHEKEGNVNIDAKVIEYKKDKDKSYIRLEFTDVNKTQESVLIKNIYSFSWRWNE